MQRITTAHPEPFTHTLKQTLTQARVYISHISLTNNTNMKRYRRVVGVYISLKPEARSCTKNSSATIGIINIACPFPP